MRTVLILFFIFLSIKFVQNTSCAMHPDLAGYCGCCPLIGGTCIHYNTIDGMDTEWHTCVPNRLKNTFSLEQCQQNISVATNVRRICRIKNRTFHLFHQCIKKNECLSARSQRNFTFKCNAPMAVKGDCEQSLLRFSYDAKRHECAPFLYSGCGGSSNRFIHQDRCEKLCKKSS